MFRFTAPTFLALLAFVTLPGCTSTISPQEAASDAAAEVNRTIVENPLNGQRVAETARVLFADILEARHAQRQPPQSMIAPRLLTRVAPFYPPDERRRWIQGIVWLAFFIDTTGTPTLIREVPDATGTKDPAFVASAIKAVSKWRFTPALADGHPVETFQAIPIVFQLTSFSSVRRNAEPDFGPLVNERFAESEATTRLLKDYYAAHPAEHEVIEEAYRRGHFVQPPALLSVAKYGYPNGWKATMEKIWVTAFIDVDGRVTSVACSADPSTPNAQTHAEAVEREVSAWHFTPMQLEGRPYGGVNVFAVVTDGVSFYLRSTDVF